MGAVAVELAPSLSDACQRLWDLDHNRLTPGKDYEINVQHGKRFGDRRDGASQPLFSRVDESQFQRPTYKAFLRLFDNYSSATGVAEVVSEDEKRENWVFINAVMETDVMRHAHHYAVGMGCADPDPAAFKKQLYQMWFAMYRRDAEADSSGFEHVFLGEHDDGEVKGFHNWLFFYLEEKKGRLDYRGYLLPRYRIPGASVDNDDQMLSVTFDWEGQTKSVSTLFVGTSPEFEFALYTLIFLCGGESNQVEIDRYNLVIKAFAIKSKYGDKIGAVFPELCSEDV